MIPADNIIGELQTEIELPIKYVLHSSPSEEFKISIFYECFLKGDKTQRDINSQIPFATWLPGRGLATVNFTYTLLRDAGLAPFLEEFCEQAYEAWKNG